MPHTPDGLGTDSAHTYVLGGTRLTVNEVEPERPIFPRRVTV